MAKLKKWKDPTKKPNAEKLKSSGLRRLSDESRNWWELDEDKIGPALQQIVETIDNNNNIVREKFVVNAQMYGNYDSMGINSWGYDAIDAGVNNYPVYNVVQSAVDTVHSKIARDNPKPYFITSGADYFVKLRAEKMTQFVQGVFQENNLYDLANNKVFRDASIFGTGALQWSLNNENKICCEWVFIDEIKIDRMDGQKFDPRSVHLCKLIQKETLIARFPDKEKELEDLALSTKEQLTSRDTIVDFLVLTESWHLRNGKTKGRHIISCLGEVLLDEVYEEDWFPVVFFRYMDDPVGFFGRGIADTLRQAQIEINKILLMIQQSQELQAAPVIFVENGSEVSEDVLLSNNIARMIPYRSGTNPPTFLSPQALSEEIYQHLQWWITSSYQEVGISQTSVSGTKQSGVNSAIAMRTMVDIESSRFIQVSKNWEKWFVDCAEVIMKLGKKAYEKDKSFKINYMDKKAKIIKEIQWSKVNSPDDQFVIQCDTISAFPSSAAGRIQTITDFVADGWFSKERGLDLLGFDPDLDGEIKLQTSSLRLCEKRLAQMVEDNLYFHPEPQMNLKLALQLSEAWYNQLLVDDCPEDRLELVRQWMTEICTMLTGQDPQVQLLQQMFEPPKQPQQAPQAGSNPANVQPQQPQVAA